MNTLITNTYKYQDELIKKVREKKPTVERFLGFVDRPAPKVIKKKIEREVETFPELLDIYYAYKIDGDELNLLYSVGPHFEEKVKDLIDSGNSMNAMILDKIGVICLDVLRSLIVRDIRLKDKKSPEKFFYPGGKDYGLDLQEEIYKMVDPGYIKINSHYQLYPIKTVALRAKLKDAIEDEDINLSPCRTCDFPCDMRGEDDE